MCGQKLIKEPFSLITIFSKYAQLSSNTTFVDLSQTQLLSQLTSSIQLMLKLQKV